MKRYVITKPTPFVIGFMLLLLNLFCLIYLIYTEATSREMEGRMRQELSAKDKQLTALKKQP